MAIINKQLIQELKVQTKLMDKPDELRVIAKLIHPMINWKWYLICFFHPYDDNTIYAILNGMATDFGNVGLEEINTHKTHGMAFEIEENFKPCNAQELFLELKKITV